MARGTAGDDDIAAAVWAVVAAGGFAGLTVRAVAAALGRTTGLVMHRFPTKAALEDFALEVLEERTARRRALPEPDARAALRTALIGMLPLDEESTTTNRVWIASWDAALAREAVRVGHAERYRHGRERLAALLAGAGVRDPGAAARVQAAMLGLIVQSVLDPEGFPPELRVARVDALIDDEAGGR